MATLAPLIKGSPLIFKLKNTAGSGVFDFSTNPVYLFVENVETKTRTVLKCVPGDGTSDGEYSLVSGVQYVTFRKPAEWTRVVENLPAGRYRVWAYLGPLTGHDGKTPTQGLPWEVRLPDSGLPFALP